MAFRIRRGLLANIGSMDPPPTEGELFYTTDTKGLYVGDDEGVANLVSSAVVTVNGQQGAVDLVTDDIPEEVGATNLWFTDLRAQDAIGTALDAGSGDNVGITFNYAAGVLSAEVTFPPYPGSGTVNTGTTNSIAYYTGNTAEVDNAVGLQWNNVSKILTISEGTATLTTNSSAKDMLILNSYTDTVQGLTRYRRARGTAELPTTLQDYDAIHTLLFDAYDGTSFNVAGGISVNVGGGSSTGISPGLMTFTITNASGVPVNTVRIAQSGRLTVGPYGVDDTSVSGSVDVVQTRNPTTEFPLLNLSNIFTGTDGVRIGMSKSRGTFAARTTAVSGDTIGTLEYFGFDGTNSVQAAEIRVTIDSTVSTGVVPGAITFETANSLGVLTSTSKMSKKGLEVLTGAVKLPVYATTTARDTSLASPEAGMLVFIETGAKIQINTDNTTGGWVDLN